MLGDRSPRPTKRTLDLTREREMEYTFTCGHSQAEAPRNMGRGAAREKRLIAYFNRKCLACRLERERILEATLTRPRTAQKLEEAMQQIIYSYW